MKKNGLLSIGEMAKVCDITAKTLKHYEKTGLLLPAYVDSESGYRYYDYSQIFNIVTIKKLRFRGFPLAEIKAIIQSKNFDTIQDFYQNKSKQIKEEIKRLKGIEKNIDHRLDILDSAKKKVLANEPDVFTKQIAERHVVFIRKKEPYNTKNIALNWNQIQKWLMKKLLTQDVKSINEYLTIFYDDINNFDINNFDVEQCNVINHLPKENYQYIRTIPKGEYATIIYEGVNEQALLLLKYKRLLKYIKNHTYLIDGPLIRHYISPYTLNLTEKMIIELQIKVKK